MILRIHLTAWAANDTNSASRTSVDIDREGRFLKRNKPAVTAIDVLYTGRSSDQADMRLANAAKSLGNVVTASIAEFGEDITWEGGHATSINNSAVVNYEAPYTELAECTTTGHINAISDLDSVMRHALLYVDTETDGRVYSLSSEVARLYKKSH